jgi:hypothetical protein
LYFARIDARAVLSFLRKRESRALARPCRMPASAGMTGDALTLPKQL